MIYTLGLKYKPAFNNSFICPNRLRNLLGFFLLFNCFMRMIPHRLSVVPFIGHSMPDSF